MTIQLDHAIVPSRNQIASAKRLAKLLAAQISGTQPSIGCGCWWRAGAVTRTARSPRAAPRAESPA